MPVLQKQKEPCRPVGTGNGFKAVVRGQLIQDVLIFVSRYFRNFILRFIDCRSAYPRLSWVGRDNSGGQRLAW